MRTNPVLRKSPSSPTTSRQFSNMETHQRKLHLGWIAVVHADQRGRASTSSLTHVAFVDDRDFSRVSFREVKGDGRPNHAGPEDDNVRRGGPGVHPGAVFGLEIHVDETLGDLQTVRRGINRQAGRRFSAVSSRISVLRVLVTPRPPSIFLFSSRAIPAGPRYVRAHP